MLVTTLATEKLTEPGVDVDAWGHPGPPHIRLDFTVVDAEALHYSSAMGKGQGRGAGCGTGRTDEGEQIRESERKNGSHWHLRAAQRTVWPKTGRTPPQACWAEASSQQGSWQRRRTTTARVAKTSLSVALAMYTSATNLSVTGHKALRGTLCALALFISSRTPSQRQRQRQRERHRQSVLIGSLLAIGEERGRRGREGE